MGNASFAQVTNIPDPIFEQVLLDLEIDSDGILNGQILTSDAENVTELAISPNAVPNYPYPAVNYYDGLIHDLTGIEAFVNLDSLTIQVTMIDELNIGTLSQLLYLNCVDNMLTSLDVSNNILLEYLNITSGGDVTPYNDIFEINLSTNPNIHTIIAPGISKINLNNNDNNAQMLINISCNYCWSYPPEYVNGNVCIQVDHVELAQNNQYPYSNWTIYNANMTYNFTENLAQCSLSMNDYATMDFILSPNPASDILNIAVQDNTAINKVMIFDLLGRKIMEQDDVEKHINISQMQSGTYLLKVFTAQGSKSEKFIIR